LYKKPPSSTEIIGDAPFGKWKTQTFLAGLRCYTETLQGIAAFIGKQIISKISGHGTRAGTQVCPYGLRVLRRIPRLVGRAYGVADVLPINDRNTAGYFSSC